MVAGVHYTVTYAARPQNTTGWVEPYSLAQRKGIQEQLRRLGRYRGPGGGANTLGKVDGIWGVETIKGLQRSINAMGTHWVTVDGIVGTQTLEGMSRYSRRSGTGMGPGGATDYWWAPVLTRLRSV